MITSSNPRSSRIFLQQVGLAEDLNPVTNESRPDFRGGEDEGGELELAQHSPAEDGGRRPQTGELERSARPNCEIHVTPPTSRATSDRTEQHHLCVASLRADAYDHALSHEHVPAKGSAENGLISPHRLRLSSVMGKMPEIAENTGSRDSPWESARKCMLAIMGNFDDLVVSQDALASQFARADADNKAQIADAIRAFLQAMETAGNPGLRVVPVISTIWRKGAGWEQTTVCTLSGWGVGVHGRQYGVLTDGRVLSVRREGGYSRIKWADLPSISAEELEDGLSVAQGDLRGRTDRGFAASLAKTFRECRP